MKELLTLFLAFARVGAFTFGGGYAMLPMLQRELVDKKGWITEQEIMDYYAIGQLTPGVIAVNVAGFVGQKRKGIIGGIVATLGIIFPSLIIILLIAALISNFAQMAVVQYAFAGIRVAVLALIVQTIVKMTKAAGKDIFTLIIFILTFVLMLFKVSAVITVIGAAVLGILYKKAVKR